jgi:general secretion pathway protein N
MARRKMTRQFIYFSLYTSLAIGLISLNGAIAQVATGATLEENDLKQTGRGKLPVPAVIQTPGVQLPPPGGNPLWGIPMSALTVTRERPVFSATRRPPAPPPAPKPVEAPAPPPAAPEQPLLSLLGTATGETDNVAVVIDQTTKNLVRLHVGEAISGWFLRSLDSRTMTIVKDSRAVTLALPAGVNSLPPNSSAGLPEEKQASGAF